MFQNTFLLLMIFQVSFAANFKPNLNNPLIYVYLVNIYFASKHTHLKVSSIGKGTLISRSTLSRYFKLNKTISFLAIKHRIKKILSDSAVGILSLWLLL